MRPNRIHSAKLSLYTCFLLLFTLQTKAQRFLSDFDSTLYRRDTVIKLLNRLDNLYFSGYMQPQFQVAQQKGIESYAGGDFREEVDNRFMLRRARIKLDYLLPGKAGSYPRALFTFQLEATERDVNVRDMFVKVFEPKNRQFAFTAGLFSRPFGYEVNLSSAFRESPERGRASQILMPSERDLGAMVSYDFLKNKKGKTRLRVDAGLFNGQGKSGPAEFDSYKDLISRLVIKPVSLNKTLSISGGLSLLHGGWAQSTQYLYEMGTMNGDQVFAVDSSLRNIGAKAPRHYYGADVQIMQDNPWGQTEIRAEYWRGTQPGTAGITTNPGVLPEGPTYIRRFDAAFFYFLQYFGAKWQLVVKYDWYDPNTAVSEKAIGRAGTNLTEADISYHTFGAGINYHFNENLKLLAYYDRVRNESTSLNGFESDLKDNVFTLRMQMRF